MQKKWLSETTKQCIQHMASIDITDAPTEICLKPSWLIYCIYRTVFS